MQIQNSLGKTLGYPLLLRAGALPALRRLDGRSGGVGVHRGR